MREAFFVIEVCLQFEADSLWIVQWGFIPFALPHGSLQEKEDIGPLKK